MKKPVIPLPPLQQLLPVVVGQSPAVQLSGAPAVVQVLVPSNQIIPNQIPVLVPSNVQQTTTTTTTTTLPPPAIVSTTGAPPAHPPLEAQTISSYILSSSTSQVTSSTTQIPIKIEDATEIEIAPEEIPLNESDPIIESLESPRDMEPALGPEVSVAQLPISSRMHYSADPSTENDNELLSNGILAAEPVPEIIMPPVAESSHRKIIAEDDPPEMLHDQEMPPSSSTSSEDEQKQQIQIGDLVAVAA